MRTSLLGAVALAALGTVGCGTAQTSFVKSDTTLGRVVVYRNGVAYFERYADVQGDSLRLNVPRTRSTIFSSRSPSSTPRPASQLPSRILRDRTRVAAAPST